MKPEKSWLFSERQSLKKIITAEKLLKFRVLTHIKSAEFIPRTVKILQLRINTDINLRQVIIVAFNIFEQRIV